MATRAKDSAPEPRTDQPMVSSAHVARRGARFHPRPRRLRQQALRIADYGDDDEVGVADLATRDHRQVDTGDGMQRRLCAHR